MSLKSAPYYWVECDYPGCGTRRDYGDYSAMSDEDQAREYYGEDGWILGSESGTDYCYGHTTHDDETGELVPLPEVTA